MQTYRLLQGEAVRLDGFLLGAIQQAVCQCPGINEEEGGFILRKEENFEFVKISNQHTGTSAAAYFYEANRTEYGSKVISKYNDGFKNHASFHTHPLGCRARPSMTDLSRLFNGAPCNFIWSPSFRELIRYIYISGLDASVTSWAMADILNFKKNIPGQMIKITGRIEKEVLSQDTIFA